MAAPRVLLFSFNYPPLDGGVSRLCAELVIGLQRKGVLIHVLSQRRHGAGSRIPSAQENRIATRRPWRELAALRALRRAGPNSPVISGLWYPEGLLAILAGARPLIVLAHGLELNPTRERWRRQLWRWMMQLVVRKATIVVANSQYTANLVDRVAPGTEVTALPLGVDHHRFVPGNRQSARQRLGVPEDRLVILTVARAVANKGHRLVLEALASLAEPVRERFLYLVAGRGRDLAVLKEEANKLGLGHVVRWLGYVPEVDLPELYQSADLFALCTREEPGQPDVEGFGLAFLEAQACGIPVVGTRTGGITDAVQEGRGGWLIDQDDVAALRAIFSALAEAPESFHRMGLAARERVEQECTWDHYVDRFLAALAQRGIALC